MLIRKITSEEVVSIFLEFFEKHAHLRIPGRSLVPQNDPSLLYINSGMAPMKPYFLGQEVPPQPDLCNVQRCLRTNDIDEVGDRHHLTFFEMMGSWSIGHYWKPNATKLAWDLLVNGFGFPPERLYATVYAGDPVLGIPADDESIECWRAVGMPDDHIVRLGADNFWGPAGDYGPCGPCTELFFDTGAAFGPDYVPGGHFDDVSRFIEIWNAGVFMEYNKLPVGMSKLDMRSVDTGAGLERLVMTLNGFSSCYETDLLKPLMDFTLAQLGETIAREAPAPRIISDHIRAAAMILADGVKPAPSGPGYIPRRLIRRAIATAVQMGKPDFDFSGLMALAIDNAKSWNTQVASRRERIISVFDKERADFDATLQSGLKRLADAFEEGSGALSGSVAFNLFSTYGLPVDTVREYVAVRKGTFDEAGFEAEFKKHQEVSRNLQEGEAPQTVATLGLDDVTATTFLGYDRLQANGTIKAVLVGDARVPAAKEGEAITIIADRTSFYAESGGQVGDTGILRTADGTMAVEDTVKLGAGVFAHKGHVTGGTIAPDAEAEFEVEPGRRAKIMANHTATHLMHAALRKILGPEVGQAGSRVDPERLRFDFTYGAKMTEEQITQVEDMVNAAIRENYPLVMKEMSYDEAVAEGALAFFAEKYGDVVRTIRFGDYSMELCGGIHVPATGEIGLFLVQSEASVSRGVRRIQAVTGAAALERVHERNAILARLSKLVNATPDELETRVQTLATQQKAQAKAAPAIKTNGLADSAKALPDGVKAIIAAPQIDPKTVRETAIDLAKTIDGIAVIMTKAGPKVKIAVAVADTRTGAYQATDILEKILPKVGGSGGGGKATLAEGMGTWTDTIPAMGGDLSLLG